VLVLSIPIGILIGVLLGIVGFGGSLLGTPLLILVAGFNFYDASTSALFIVLTSSLLALALRDRTELPKRILLPAIVFGMLGTPLGSLASMALPNDLSKLILAVLLVAAGVLAWRGMGSEQKAQLGQTHPVFAALMFAFVGFTTGLTGVGGGYLLVPGLIFIYGLTFSVAVTTSLAVVVFNALISLSFRMWQGVNFSTEQWFDVGLIVVAALIGSAIGSLWIKKINKALVQRIFAILLFALAAALTLRILPA